MAEGAYVTILPMTTCVVCHITSEKVGAREAGIIEQEARGAGPGKKWKMIVDLKDVTMLASMGLGVLVSLHKSCAAEGGRLIVCGLREDIVQLMKLTHLERILKIAKDRDAAVKMMG